MAMIHHPRAAAPIRSTVGPPDVRDVSPDEWDGLGASDPAITPSQTRAWTALVARTAGLDDLSTLFTFPDGDRLLLPLVGRRWPTGGVAVAASMPAGWGFGGVLVDGSPGPEHLGHVWRHLASQPCIRIRLRPNPLQAVLWAESAPPQVRRIDRRAHVVDLRGGFDEVWGRASSTARSNARRAVRLGVEITCGIDDRHRSAYRSLLARSRDRWSTQHREPHVLARWRAERSDPWERLDAMIQSPDLCTLWVAWYGSSPAAAIIVAVDRNAHYTRGVMDRELAATTRANDLLQRTAMEHACAAGCTWYHMGESGTSQSLAHYKERFGARPHDYVEYLLERAPLHSVEQWCRDGVKRAIGYRDA